MQKSKHKLESKPNIFTQKNKSTIETNYETIETEFDQDFCEMKNVACYELEMSPESNIMVNGEDEKALRQNDSVHLEIELDDGKIEIIKPNPYDDPYLLAKNFCTINELDEEMIPLLASNIEKTIQKIIKTNTSTINELQKPKNKEIKNTRINTEPFVYDKRSNTPTENLSKQKSATKHFESISKQFSKKKVEHQNSIEEKKHLTSFNGDNRSHKLNKNFQSIESNKIKNESNKKSTHNESLKTEKSQKTEQSELFENKASPYIKENKAKPTFFDYLPQKQNLKNKYNFEGFMKRNCGYEPQSNKNSDKSMQNKPFEEKQAHRKSGSKESLKKSFTRSIDGSVDSESSCLNHNRRLPLVNYSLVSLSRDSNQGRQLDYRKKQASHSILQNPTSSSQHILQTHRLYENQKQKAFKSIFALLDDDGDGVISIVNINLVEKIEQRLIQVLFPVLEEMEILETELNEEEFIQALENLFIKLSVEEKSYLLKYFNKQEQEKQKTIANENQPKMSPISMELVNQTERRNVTVYEYSRIREEMKNKKLEKQRVEKERSMMRNCTFHPKVNSRKIIYF